MQADLLILEHPLPVVATVEASAGFIAAHQTSAPQPLDNLRHWRGKLGLNPLEQIRNRPF
jgi:hypothetical protein